jgi:hypothetical protein
LPDRSAYAQLSAGFTVLARHRKHAEPGHRTMTKKQWDAKMARWDREFKARQAADDKRHECDRERCRDRI